MSDLHRYRATVFNARDGKNEYHVIDAPTAADALTMLNLRWRDGMPRMDITAIESVPLRSGPCTVVTPTWVVDGKVVG